ncbi:MAG: TetR/AcrR family transcriptional regulator [Acidimicrobiia bacterium]|nr:TetR/AcrR family transcriptional regulator [Acidimicrobiia bacterium]
MSARAARRTRARRGEGARLRDEILDAGEALLVQTGDEEAVSMRAIARAAGVTPPSIYLHFPDKATLIFEVCERQFERFTAHLEETAVATGDLVETLRLRARAYVGFGLEHPEHFRVLFMARRQRLPDGVGVEETAGGIAFERLVTNVREAIEAGLLRPDLDPRLTALGLWCSIHGLTTLMLALPDYPWPDLDVLLDHLAATHLHGLAGGSEGPRG